MTREQAKKLLPIFTAFAEGKEIQFRQIKPELHEWVTASHGHLDFNHKPESYELRIKPEPREVVVAYNKASREVPCFVTRSADLNNYPFYDLVKFREVIE